MAQIEARWDLLQAGQVPAICEMRSELFLQPHDASLEKRMPLENVLLADTLDRKLASEQSGLSLYFRHVRGCTNALPSDSKGVGVVNIKGFMNVC